MEKVTKEYFCDRCGRQISANPTDSLNRYRLNTEGVTELCDECNYLFYQFLKGKATPEVNDEPVEDPTEYCPSCNMPMLDGVCHNSSCSASPDFVDPTPTDWCPSCGSQRDMGVCSNPGCPEYVDPGIIQELCSQCGMPLDNGVCSNTECPTNVEEPSL